MRASFVPPPTSALLTPDQLTIERLEGNAFPSPIPHRGGFVEDDDAVLVHSDARELKRYLDEGLPPPAFEPAGPRAMLHFDPAKVKVGVVTCGGLCPGINDVIRSLVMTLKYSYGCDRVIGFRYGYTGLGKTPHKPLLNLDVDRVRRIHEDGGTTLGSARGNPPVPEMVDTLVANGINVLFTIGGDGTLRGAQALVEEIKRRGEDIVVIGVPKTIDNDLHWVERTFGFATAVEEACVAIQGAHVEAEGAFNGVGLVKLMGRHSGFIAAVASLSNSDVNFCLVPEVPLVLEGERGFLSVLEQRLDLAKHAVIVVAEGAGQDLCEASGTKDAGGNVRLADIGGLLKGAIKEHFARIGKPLTLKYIDPSYMVRSLPGNAYDSALCLMLGQHAVHAAMAGRTNMLVGLWNQRFTHIPMSMSTRGRKQIDPEGELWQAVLGGTGQPSRWG